MSSSDIWLNYENDGRRFAAAIGIGLIVELAALGGLLPVLAHPAPPARQPSVVKISMDQPPPAPKPPAPAPKPPPPKPVPPTPVTPPKPTPPPPPRAVAHHVVHHLPPPPVTPPPMPQTPPPPDTPPAPQLPPAPSLGEVDQFRVSMREAVQAVANQVYPQAAQMAHETGTVGVSFTYLNGAVTDISLAQSSGFPLLDAAALQAARIAQYPQPPSGFAGRSYTVEVQVVFQLAAASVDGD